MYKRYDHSDREEYYEQFTFPKSILQFLKWQTDTRTAILLNPGLTVRFKNIEFGTSKKQVYEKNGKPRYLRLGGVFAEKKHEIAFYKEMFYDNKLISQLHFIDDLFFYGCHTFRSLPSDNFSLIKKTVLEKYGLRNFDDKNYNVLTDSHKNQIRFVDNVFLNLVYLSGEERFKIFMEEYAREYSFLKKKNQKSFLTELYGLL